MEETSTSPNRKPRSKTPRTLVLATTLLVLIVGGLASAVDAESKPSAPGSGGGKGGGGGQKTPYPTTTFYLQRHTGPAECTILVQCRVHDQPTGTQKPTSPTPALYSPFTAPNPQLDNAASWITPWNRSVSLNGDNITVTVFGDTVKTPTATTSFAQATLFAGLARGSLFHKGTLWLQYVPGSGTASSAGVQNAMFQGTFTNLSGGGVWMLYLQRGTEGGPLVIRYDSVESPACLTINGIGCPR